MILSYDELVTLLARISCSMNSRPLALANTSYTDPQEDILLPITPNHMLLGRPSPESPPLEFCQRLAYVDAVEQELWSRWIKTVLPTMVPVPQVQTEEKNLVRRVSVKYKRKNAREARTVCRSKMEEKIVAVQRLVLLEPAPSPSALVNTPSYSSAPAISPSVPSSCSFLFITTFQFLLFSFTMILN